MNFIVFINRMIILILMLLLLSNDGISVSCQVSSTGINFGKFNPLKGSRAISGDLKVTCDVNTSSSYSIKLSKGFSNTYLVRKMKIIGEPSPSDFLMYNIYTDPSHKNIWGDGISEGTLEVVGRIKRRSIFRMWGLIFKDQLDVRSGSYDDVIYVTVEW